MNLAGINQSPKDRYSAISLDEIPRVVKFIDTDNSMAVAGVGAGIGVGVD